MKKIGMMMLCMALVLGLAGCGSSGSSSDDGSIKIGLHFEMTGDYADYGMGNDRGAILAIKEANGKAGQELYKTVSYDNKSDTSEAVILANQLVNDGVIGVLGPATSGLSAATYQILNDAGIPVVSPSATQIDVTLNPSGKVYDYVFRTCFEDSYQGAAMAQYAYDVLGKTNIAIFADSASDYAKGLTESFTEQFTKLGGKIAATEYYVAGETDFSSVLTTISSKEFDAMYIPGYYQEAGLIIKQARELGIEQPILGPDGFDSETLMNLAGSKSLNEVYYTTAYTTINASEELEHFINAYRAEYNEEPNMFAALGYDAANLLIQAIEEAGSSDRAAIQKALLNIEFNGITGSFSFDDTHTPIKSVLVVTLENGVQTKAESISPKTE